jgi:hypothetical protein
MSNYTKTTDFEAKDSLPSGDSGKIIRGSEFETEFDNIATAIASKSDANNPTFTGTVTIDGLTVNGNTVLGNAATDTVTVTADIASNLLPSADDTYNLGASGAEWNDLHVDGVAYIDTINGFAATGDVNFGDNNKAVFGAGSDLEIYHSSNQSIIKESGAGSLLLQGDNIRLQKVDGTENMITAVNDAEVSLFYNGAEKLATTLTGIDVTGTVTTDGLTVDGSVAINSSVQSASTTNQLTLRGGTGNVVSGHVVGGINFDSFDLGNQNTSASISAIASGSHVSGSTLNTDLNFKTADGSSAVSRLNIAHNGDISFYEDTGTTAKLFWDSSAERLGLGTTSPDADLDVRGTTLADVHIRATSANSIARAVFQNDAQSYAVRINGDDKFRIKDETADADRLVVDTSGNVGIGTDSPQYPLHTYGAVGISDDNDSARYRFIVDDDGTDARFRIRREKANGASSSSNDLTIVGGNVGIGTSSPVFSAGSGLRIERDSTATLRLQDTGAHGFEIRASASAAEFVTANSKPFTFGHLSSEHMRIDSSGNLLVGTTTTNIATEGTVIYGAGNEGVMQLSSTAMTALYVNRSNDGELVQFRKNSVAVGSIGSTGGDLMVGTGDVNIRFDDGADAIVPRNSNGGGRDAAVDIGLSTVRFKDLYLSGGAYLGGTAAANKLDDYEEGTWTPVYEPETGSFTTMTMDNVSNTYTKIGDTVIAMCYVRTSDVDVTGASGDLRLGGLPFTISGYFEVSIGNVFGWTGERPDGGYGFTGQDYIKLRYRSSVTSDSADSSVTDLTTGTTANRNQIILTFIYKTTA